MELSSAKFELLGDSKTEECILVIWQGLEPEKGIRFQVKASLEAEKIIAKILESRKEPD